MSPCDGGRDGAAAGKEEGEDHRVRGGGGGQMNITEEYN